jgi:SPP1 family predicted phage head-tail adaptor
MGKFPEIGEMVERVTLQRSVKADDEYHGKQVVWLDVAEVWAKVEPISSREYFFGQANQAEVTHRIQMRYRSDIGQEWQIKHRDAYYSIRSVIDMGGSRRFLELLCVETKEPTRTFNPFFDLGTFVEPGISVVDLGEDT